MGAWSSWSRREFVFARFPSGRINKRTRIEREPRLPEGDAISDPEGERVTPLKPVRASALRSPPCWCRKKSKKSDE